MTFALKSIKGAQKWKCFKTLSRLFAHIDERKKIAKPSRHSKKKWRFICWRSSTGLMNFEVPSVFRLPADDFYAACFC